MSGAFDEPEKITAPAVSDPEPLPTVEDDVGDEVAKQEQKKSGANKAFVTGNLTPKSTGKKKFLG